MKVSRSIIIVVALVIVAIAIAFLGATPAKYDEFAQCLTDNGVKMYGAFWCPHCQNQKKLFGDSWKNINYIECSLPDRSGQTQICTDQNIESYPTWEFANGERISKELPISKLAQLSGCKT